MHVRQYNHSGWQAGGMPWHTAKDRPVYLLSVRFDAPERLFDNFTGAGVSHLISVDSALENAS